MAVTRVAYEVESWGVGELWVDDERVVWHESPHLVAARTDMAVGRPRGPSLTPTLPRGNGSLRGDDARDRADFVNFVIGAVTDYLAGTRTTLADVPVDLEYESAFHERCAEALRAVPRGEVVTYGELAALAGAPRAARAAGSFCARNRLGLFVPCHRVVAANGIGSYGSLGVEHKRRLLRLEGVAGALG